MDRRYAERCASCHGPTLGGAQGPPLIGDEFVRMWSGPLSELVSKIQNTMPANDPGKLTGQQSADVVAYMLQAGKFVAGQAELGFDDAALKAILLPVSFWRNAAACRHGRCSAGADVPTRREHGAADARHSVSQLQPAVQRPEPRSGRSAAAAAVESGDERSVPVGGLGRRNLFGLGDRRLRCPRSC